jgi:hypothetical protein
MIRTLPDLGAAAGVGGSFPCLRARYPNGRARLDRRGRCDETIALAHLILPEHLLAGGNRHREGARSREPLAALNCVL